MWEAFEEGLNVIRDYFSRDKTLLIDFYKDRPDIVTSMKNADSLLSGAEATSGDIDQIRQVIETELRRQGYDK